MTLPDQPYIKQNYDSKFRESKSSDCLKSICRKTARGIHILFALLEKDYNLLSLTSRGVKQGAFNCRALSYSL
uniref:Uncharacterized protein n=1 Tax=Romanomermis culicivorax TaxID=13658 RepID=A0A915IZQ5_ROMCU